MNTHEQPTSEIQAKWDRALIEQRKTILDNFVLAANKFLADGTPLTTEQVVEVKDAVEFLGYADEQGTFTPSSYLYDIECHSGISGKQLFELTKQYSYLHDLYEAFSRAQNAWRFMRNPQSDTSKTMPASLRREITEVGGKEMARVNDFYFDYIKNVDSDKTTLPQKLVGLLEQVNDSLAAVQKKADPYIAADMHLTIKHMDEFESLRREMQRAGGIEVYFTGEQASEATRLILSKKYPAEYQGFLQQYKDGEIQEPPLPERNKIIKIGSAMDDEFKQKYPR